MTSLDAADIEMKQALDATTGYCDACSKRDLLEEMVHSSGRDNGIGDGCFCRWCTGRFGRDVERTAKDDAEIKAEALRLWRES